MCSFIKPFITKSKSVFIFEMGIDVKDDDSLDKVFVEVGEFKIYQIFLILLICIPSVLSAVFQVHFIFVTATLDYR